MAVRYEGNGDEPDLELVDEVNTFDLNETGKGYHGKLSTLLQWHNEDPVDSFEINRNNVIYSFQENRNPFIDHPEYVDLIWSGLTSTELIKKSDITFYPNPAKEYAVIEMTDGNNAERILYNSSGKAVKRFEMHNRYKLSTTAINSGIYILQVATEDQFLCPSW